MKQRLANIYQLGIKELLSLSRDPVMVFLIIFCFTIAIRSGARGAPGEVNRAPIAVVDEDRSPLSERMTHAFYPPRFRPAAVISPEDMDRGLDSARYTFVLDIPPHFERDVRAGRRPKIQLNIDATVMSQAFLGANYAEKIVMDEIQAYLAGHRVPEKAPINLVVHYKFNPNQSPRFFGAVVELINQVTLLAVLLTAGALIREREHGTLEHLMVMPLQPLDIMAAKLWSNGLVVLVATALSVKFTIGGWLQIPLHGSLGLFLFGVALHLLSATSLGVLLGTVARTAPQMGLLVMLVILPLEMLSGGYSSFQSMSPVVQWIMHGAPTMWFVRFAKAILFRGAGFSVVWPCFLAEVVLAGVFISVAIRLFRKSLAAAV